MPVEIPGVRPGHTTARPFTRIRSSTLFPRRGSIWLPLLASAERPFSSRPPSFPEVFSLREASGSGSRMPGERMPPGFQDAGFFFFLTISY